MINESHDHFDLTRDEQGIVTLTIARSGKLNLLSSPVIRDVIAGINELSTDAGIRTLVLTGDGTKAFIGGTDVAEMATLKPDTAERFITDLRDLCDAIRQFPVPVIARIKGWCLGGGLEVAAACDVRVATTGSNFGMPEVRMGIPSVIHAALLPGLIGAGRARWFMLTASIVDSTRAQQWGLVDVVVDESELDSEIESVVASILACGPQVMRSQKRLLNAWDEGSLNENITASIKELGAQLAYMRNLALEVAPYVQINATAQTYVDNPTYFPPEYQKTEDFRARLAECPAGRLATMRECAQTVLFLAGPESDFFYGQTIPFAGGWTV